MRFHLHGWNLLRPRDGFPRQVHRTTINPRKKDSAPIVRERDSRGEKSG